MADLQDLCNTLQALADNGGSAKVSFYYVDADGITLRNGAILVDHGVLAHVDHRQLAGTAAIDAIARLKLVKVASLQLSEVQPTADMAALDLPQLIAGLRAHRPASASSKAATNTPPPADAFSPGSTAQFVAILAGSGSRPASKH